MNRTRCKEADATPLQLVTTGKISIGRAAELLDVPVQDLQLRVAACAGPTAEQLQSSARTLATLNGK